MDKMLYIRNFKKDLIADYFVDAFDAMIKIARHSQSDFIPTDKHYEDYLFNMVATFLSVGGLFEDKKDTITRIRRYKHTFLQLVNIRNFIFENFLKIVNNKDDGLDIFFYKMENCSIDMHANKRAGKFETTIFPDDNSLLNIARLAFGCILTGLEINPAKILRCKRANCMKFFYAGKVGSSWKFKRRYCSTKCANAQRLLNWRRAKEWSEVNL